MWRKKGLDQGFRENGTQVCLLCFFVISGVFQDMSPGCSFQNWEEKRNMGGVGNTGYHLKIPSNLLSFCLIRYICIHFIFQPQRSESYQFFAENKIFLVTQQYQRTLLNASYAPSTVANVLHVSVHLSLTRSLGGRSYWYSHS